MANAIYPKWKEAAGTGAANVSLVAGQINVTLIDAADYTYSAAHQFISDVPGAARVATAALANTTFASGLFNADDVTFPSVTGDPSEALVIWKDTGVEATSRLVAYLDTDVLGLPATPNGSNIDVSWDPAGIFQL
jgi:hypothetical protein